MKNSSTLLLKVAIGLIGAGVLAICVLVLPKGIIEDRTGFYRPILIGMYLPAIPFFIGLFQGMKLLTYIDKNDVFSKASVKALAYIKYCGISIGGMYAAGIPLIIMAALRDDAPGVALLGFIFTFTPLLIAACAAMLQSLLQKVIDIKAENALTI